MNDTPPSPCPVEQLIEHSAMHFQAFPESFEQLAARRVKNLVFMDSLLSTLCQEAPSPDQCDAVHEARILLDGAIDRIRQAIKGR